MLLDKACIQIRLSEGFTGGEVIQKIDIGGQAGDPILGQRHRQALQGLGPVFSPDNEFGDHGVIVDADFVTLAHAGINPYMRAFHGCL